MTGFVPQTALAKGFFYHVLTRIAKWGAGFLTSCSLGGLWGPMVSSGGLWWWAGFLTSPLGAFWGPFDLVFPWGPMGAYWPAFRPRVPLGAHGYGFLWGPMVVGRLFDLVFPWGPMAMVSSGGLWWWAGFFTSCSPGGYGFLWGPMVVGRLFDLSNCKPSVWGRHQCNYLQTSGRQRACLPWQLQRRQTSQ